MTMQQTVSPVDGRVYVERELADTTRLDRYLTRAVEAQHDWHRLPLAERAVQVSAMVDMLLARRDDILPELSWQMGRPISAAPGELKGFEERARHMIAIAEDALADQQPGDKAGLVRFIRREPLGVILVVAPWNYPYLTSVNSVVPALMAGNSVVLKHSSQTPLCAERYREAALAAGLPEGLLQVLPMDHATTASAMADPRVGFVAFTGSVAGGHAVQKALTGRFISSGLELGGKDPAYVRADADLDHAVENLVDGAFFNSGQSCCGIERIYVHDSLYDAFVDGAVALVKQYRLGNPLDPETNLGPMVRASAADLVRRQVQDAVAAGAKALIDPGHFAASRDQGPYLAPQVLTQVDHSMAIMTEETFGPVVGIMRVSSDEEAIRLMNDSHYGLTAAVWTQDLEAAIRIGERIDTGTWFMNRCDYLDPALAWTGVKNSGRGCTLSAVGYEQLTRPKSFHLRSHW